MLRYSRRVQTDVHVCKNPLIWVEAWLRIFKRIIQKHDGKGKILNGL